MATATSPDCNAGELPPVWWDASATLHHRVHLVVMQTVDELFSDAGIEYWLSAGTLMGAYRHNGFIPHDDDVDLEVRLCDLPKIRECVREANDSGLCDVEYKPYKRWQDLTFAQLVFWGDVKVDLFYQQMEDDAEQQHPMLHNLQIEVFPLRRIPFCNLMLPAPRTSVECMERQYGANWSTQVMVWNHLFNSENMPNHDKCRVTLKLEEYNALVANAGFAQPLAQTSAEASRAACVAAGDVAAYKQNAARRREQKALDDQKAQSLAAEAVRQARARRSTAAAAAGV